MKLSILIIIPFLFIACNAKSEYIWSTNNDKIIFKCSDVSKVYGIANHPNSVKIFLTKDGAEKICKFTKKHTNQKIKMLLNTKEINSGIKILEPINCDFKENVTSIRTNFNTQEDLRELAKALCKN